MARLLDEFRPAEVPYCDALELADCSSICTVLCPFLEKINVIGRHEIHMMLKARVMKPANSLWSFPVVIAR